MKRLWQGLFICCLGLVFMFAGMNSASATDVWVDHWNYENIDIYVMNDTITYSSDSNGRGFQCPLSSSKWPIKANRGLEFF